MVFSISSMPPHTVAAPPAAPRMISLQPKPQSLAARRAQARAQLSLNTSLADSKGPSLKIDLSQVAAVPRESDRNLKQPPTKPSAAELDQMSPEARTTALNTFENWKLGKAKFDEAGNQMKSPAPGAGPEDGSESAVSLTHSSSTPSLSSLTTPSTGQSLAADGNFEPQSTATAELGLDLKPADQLSPAGSPRSANTTSTVLTTTAPAPAPGSAGRRESSASTRSGSGSPKSRQVSFLCGSKQHVLALGEEPSANCSCPIGTPLNLIPPTAVTADQE